MKLMSHTGEVSLEVAYGQDSESGEWVSPVRRAWGLEQWQRLTPELEHRLCLTATRTSSYHSAAEVAACWGSPVCDDSTIHRHVQRAGERSRERDRQREEAARVPVLHQEIVRRAARENGCQTFSLVLMLDGWMARERGSDWGLKPLETKGDRVSWREMKTAIIMRTDHRGTSCSGRAMVVEKAVVAHQGEWDGLAKKLYAEALRRGLKQAKEVFVVADGGVWIWNLKEERFAHATGVLDFYHASEHLWAAAHALHGDDDKRAKKWVEPLLRQLRHGKEALALKRIRKLANPPAELDEERSKTLRATANYFETHREHIHYGEVEKRGCPIGSGAMESTCAQLQTRLKRTGQFWTKTGKANILSLELAHRNGDWSQVWLPQPSQH